MTPDLPPVPPGRWLPRKVAADVMGIDIRTLQRRMKQGTVMTRHDEHNRVQVYVPDPPDTRQDREQDTAMTIRQAVMTEIAQPFLQRNAEQEAIIRQQQELIGVFRERLSAQAKQIVDLEAERAAQRRTWWRVLWQRLSGHES